MFTKIIVYAMYVCKCFACAGLINIWLYWEGFVLIICLLVEVVLVVDFDDDDIVALSCVARQRAVGSAVWRLVGSSVSRVRVTLHVWVIHWSVVEWAVVARDDGLGTARLGRRPGDGLGCPRGMMGLIMMMWSSGRENTIPVLTSISCCLLGRMWMNWLMW